jgi:hypothetical protein
MQDKEEDLFRWAVQQDLYVASFFLDETNLSWAS